MESITSFETNRLKIIATCEQDAEFIMYLMNSPKFIEYIGDRNIKTIEQAKDFIQNKMLPQLNRLGYSNYTVIRKRDNMKLGTCGLYDREGLEGIDIGFAFLPEHEGQGYAYEATNCLKNMAFEDFEIKELKAITSTKNLSSQRLLEKLGLRLEGPIVIPNDNEELLLYGLKAEH